jgi:hypothetical protein
MTTEKFKKNQEKARRKRLREEYYENNPYIPTEDELLENNSYYDIDILEKANAKTNQGIKYWEGRKAKASSWIGKWAYQTQINKLKKKLKHYES